jgi:putative Ca2+/H+ antiporter (TMEM165/GDT1 family)
MNLTVAVTSFLAVLPAELPDKTIIACMILSSRYRPGFVFVGAAAAFAAQITLAVAAGGALSLLPHQVVEALAAAAFLAGAVLVWRSGRGQEEAEDEEDSGRDGVRDGFWPVAGTSFAVVFLAEFGDLTQFLTVSLAARYHDPIAVGVGATLGLWVACGAAIVVGWRLLKFIPVKWLTRIAALIMLALAGTSAAAAAAGSLLRDRGHCPPEPVQGGGDPRQRRRVVGGESLLLLPGRLPVQP